MRTGFLLVTAVAILLVAVAPASSSSSSSAVLPASCASARLSLVAAGTLTIGTDNPAYPPWYAGGTPKGAPWKVNDPSTGKGFESAVAYAVGRELGFARGQIRWTYVPFARSFAPGPKSFDFDINQISYTPARAKVVGFSSSYYDVNQAIVVLAGAKIAHVHTIAGLRNFKLGAQIGTTSYSYIKDVIKPTSTPSAYQQNAAAIQGLKNRQIDGLVVDLPTSFYVTAVQVPNSKILGQFGGASASGYFGMVFAKGNSLIGCVDQALAVLRANGTLARLQQQWLAKATGAPVLK
jgi:polar amino acid transport system substrate-binding protein